MSLSWSTPPSPKTVLELLEAADPRPDHYDALTKDCDALEAAERIRVAVENGVTAAGLALCVQ